MCFNTLNDGNWRFSRVNVGFETGRRTGVIWDRKLGLAWFGKGKERTGQDRTGIWFKRNTY